VTYCPQCLHQEHVGVCCHTTRPRYSELLTHDFCCCVVDSQTDDLFSRPATPDYPVGG